MLVKSQPWNLKITVKTQKNFQKNTISIYLFIFNPKLKVKTLQTHTHRNTWHSKPTSTPNASQDHHTSNLSMTHHSWLRPPRPPHQIQPMAHNVNHQLNHRNPTHHNCNDPQQNRNPKTQPPQLNQTNPPPQPEEREREREREMK